MTAKDTKATMNSSPRLRSNTADQIPQRELDVVLGLGANLSEPLRTFRAALELLQRDVRITATSSVYLTRAVGPSQPDFHNAAVRGRTSLTPAALLERLLEIEAELGRVRLERWGPRVIDLDLLWIDGVSVQTPKLTVPHPRLEERAFALLPLLEVAPNACDPVSGRPYTSGSRPLQGQVLEILLPSDALALEAGGRGSSTMSQTDRD